MSTLRKLHLGLGLAFVTALGFVAGPVFADDPSDDESVGEASSALSLHCTMSGPPGERADAILTLLPGGKCRRDRTGVPGLVTTPSCHQLARHIGCFLIN
ncbi:hypothetical protein BE04_16165 [Sorangium cellulosum]|uniref:Secreted protein n=2 Tax=Sorangium cellulosum TaxID=56 RepID=A0A150PIZ7_SORCE|nr:hypothetical protein [Sorangium cellulosum]AGP39929.1 hypothetical protein SCE1572_38805 [Sorangium cellulosum So0157-2]KYF55654.1 hypothetical protein BE04_16165 [Sorangium cellulosum]KYG10654.1 hypothetical protein BE21_10710 [Sorangium cellulosum]